MSRSAPFRDKPLGTPNGRRDGRLVRFGAPAAGAGLPRLTLPRFDWAGFFGPLARGATEARVLPGLVLRGLAVQGRRGAGMALGRCAQCGRLALGAAAAGFAAAAVAGTAVRTLAYRAGHRLAALSRAGLARLGQATAASMALGWHACQAVSRGGRHGLALAGQAGGAVAARLHCQAVAGGKAALRALHHGRQQARATTAALLRLANPGFGWRQVATGALGLALAISLVHRPEAQTTGGADVINLMPAGSILADRPAEGAPGPASAGSPLRRTTGQAPASDPNAPVTFTADEVEYDRETGVVTARGHVEAWQGERVLRADEFTYNRETKVATARGNVQLLEADGQVMFADEAELKDQFKDGVLREVRALLAQNVRIAANGVRRTGGTINELSRVVYSSCDVCLNDPTVAPAWQVQARVATQDKDLQRITYRDAVMRVHGIPVFYTPYLSHPDPSAERASGWLFPQLGVTRYLGAFAMVPYYHVIDNHSDVTVTPLFSSRQYPFVLGEYRNKLNFGEIEGNASLGALNGTNKTKEQVGGHIFLRGRFVLDDHWRAGFELNRATSDTYLQTIRTWSRPVYASNAYVEGFWGTEQYARIDIRGYQSLQLNYNNDKLPYILPNAYYEYAPREKVAGGHLTLDTGLLSIFRVTGTHTQRVANRASWVRHEYDDLGGMWTFRVQGDANGYWAGGQQLDPVNLPNANGLNQNANIRAAVDWRMPFVRYGEVWGNQILEPRVQLVTGPRLGRQGRLPNEDSIDFEFTDANLFSLSRFVGRDRMEGGSRVDSALRGAWMFPNGGTVEGLVGRSYTLQDDHSTSQLYGLDGLQRRASDWVGRLRVAPVSWFETMARIRTDGTDLAQRHLVDGVARVSLGPNLSLHTGYLYATPVPYLLPIRSREEVSFGGNARAGNWRINATAKYDLSNGRFALIQGGAGYEDECVVIEARVMRRFNRDLTTNLAYPINTQVLVHIGLKTLGDYFFRAI